MATKRNTSLALLLLLNLILFSLASAWAPRSSRPGPPRSPKPRNPPCPPPGMTPPGPQPGTPTCPPPGTPPGPQPGTPPPPPGNTSCPRDALQLGICVDALGGLLNLTIGTPPVQPCCSLIEGLVDLEAAVCLCTVIRASILGININLPIALTLLLNVCSREVPRNFICA